MLAREAASLACEGSDATSALDLLVRCDALRRPERFAALLEAAADGDPSLDTAIWRAAFVAASRVDAGAIAAACADKRDIPQRVREARVAAIADR
jgi:tRNA nucleotidyltransferase (CCA-adding enzyme)